MALPEYFNQMDFATLRTLMLDMATDDVDKSEGSFLYDAVTPIALFVSEIIDQMKMVLEQSFIGTATGRNLDLLAATMPRVYRGEASPEKLKLKLVPYSTGIESFIKSNFATLMFTNSSGESFSIDKDIDDWYSNESDFITIKVKKSNTGIGTSSINDAMEPAPAISGLTECSVLSVLSRGAEEETDDHFRVRVWGTMSKPFLGTVADYQRKIFSEFPTSANGFYIENCFIMPRASKSGYICVIPAKADNQGGALQCTDGELTTLQEYLDKRVNGVGGYGLGVAPIGHVVKVRKFVEYEMKQEIEVLVKGGKEDELNATTLRADIESATKQYLRSIISETVPSATNYLQNSNRVVNINIYYYVNAHEYAILSTLRSLYGTENIRNVVIRKIDSNGLVPQKDLVLNSNSSVGTLPILTDLNVVVSTEQNL